MHCTWTCYNSTFCKSHEVLRGYDIKELTLVCGFYILSGKGYLYARLALNEVIVKPEFMETNGTFGIQECLLFYASKIGHPMK